MKKQRMTILMVALIAAVVVVAFNNIPRLASLTRFNGTAGG
jgi:hypothetical protein